MAPAEWRSTAPPPKPTPVKLASDARLAREAAATVAALEGLRQDVHAPPAPRVPVTLPTVQGLQDLVDQQHRITADLAEIDAEEQADTAAVDQRKTELTEKAAQAIVDGKKSDSAPFVKVQEEFARRQETRRLRRQALADAKVTVDAAVRRQLTHAVWEFFAQMKRRSAELVAEQARALCAFRAARTEEQALQQQALREIGRVHKMLPRLAELLGEGAKTRDPDQRLLAAFLDGKIGVPNLSTSGRQVFRAAAIEHWLQSAKSEGYDVD